jgi:hypothetical protein
MDKETVVTKLVTGGKYRKADGSRDPSAYFSCMLVDVRHGKTFTDKLTTWYVLKDHRGKIAWVQEGPRFVQIWVPQLASTAAPPTEAYRQTLLLAYANDARELKAQQDQLEQELQMEIREQESAMERAAAAHNVNRRAYVQAIIEANRHLHKQEEARKTLGQTQNEITIVHAKVGLLNGPDWKLHLKE